MDSSMCISSRDGRRCCFGELLLGWGFVGRSEGGIPTNSKPDPHVWDVGATVISSLFGKGPRLAHREVEEVHRGGGSRTYPPGLDDGANAVGALSP